MRSNKIAMHIVCCLVGTPCLDITARDIGTVHAGRNRVGQGDQVFIRLDFRNDFDSRTEHIIGKTVILVRPGVYITGTVGILHVHIDSIAFVEPERSNKPVNVRYDHPDYIHRGTAYYGRYTLVYATLLILGKAGQLATFHNGWSQIRAGIHSEVIRVSAGYRILVGSDRIKTPSDGIAVHRHRARGNRYRILTLCHGAFSQRHRVLPEGERSVTYGYCMVSGGEGPRAEPVGVLPPTERAVCIVVCPVHLPAVRVGYSAEHDAVGVHLEPFGDSDSPIPPASQVVLAIARSSQNLQPLVPNGEQVCLVLAE